MDGVRLLSRVKLMFWINPNYVEHRAKYKPNGAHLSLDLELPWPFLPQVFGDKLKAAVRVNKLGIYAMRV